jgi:hypothetical protein
MLQKYGRAVLLFAVVGVAGCGVGKKVPSGERLVDAVRLEWPDSVEVDAEWLAQGEARFPTLNRRIFGVRWPLRVGLEEPVMLGGANGVGGVEADRTAATLEARAVRGGWLGAEVTVRVDSTREGRAEIVFEVNPGQLWRVSEVHWANEASGVPTAIFTPSSLVPGMALDLARLEEERSRLESAAQTAGYASLNVGFVEFLVDTLETETGTAELTIEVRPQRIAYGDSILDVPHRPTRIGEIWLEQDLEAPLVPPLRQEYLDYLTPIETGMRYNPLAFSETYRNLMQVPAVGRVEVPTAFRFDSLGRPWVDTSIRLHAKKRHEWGGGIEMTRADVRYGPVVSLNWTNRNVSGRCDSWRWGVSGGIASTQPFSYTEASLVPNSAEWSVETQYSILGIPPFPLRFLRPSNRARTNWTASLHRESRPDYSRNTFAYRHRFSFVENPGRSSSIQVDLLEITYADLTPPASFSAWLAAQENPQLAARFNDYASALTRVQWKTGWPGERPPGGFNRLRLEWAGQALRAWAKAREWTPNESDHYIVAGIPFAQFVRLEQEARWSQAREGAHLAARREGISLPGNPIVPWNRVLGPHRAWRCRAGGSVGGVKRELLPTVGSATTPPKHLLADEFEGELAECRLGKRTGGGSETVRIPAAVVGLCQCGRKQ